MPAAISLLALPRPTLRPSIAIRCGVAIACSTVLCDRSRPNLERRVSLRECAYDEPLSSISYIS